MGGWRFVLVYPQTGNSWSSTAIIYEFTRFLGYRWLLSRISRIWRLISSRNLNMERLLILCRTSGASAGIHDTQFSLTSVNPVETLSHLPFVIADILSTANPAKKSLIPA